MKKIFIGLVLALSLTSILEAAARRSATEVTAAARQALSSVRSAAKPNQFKVKTPLTAEQQWQKSIKANDNPRGYDLAWKRAVTPKAIPQVPNRSLLTIPQKTANLPAIIQPQQKALTPLEMKQGFDLFAALSKAEGGSAARASRSPSSPPLEIIDIALLTKFARDQSVQGVLQSMRGMVKKSDGPVMVMFNAQKNNISMIGDGATAVPKNVSKLFFEQPLAKELLKKPTFLRATPKKDGTFTLQPFSADVTKARIEGEALEVTAEYADNLMRDAEALAQAAQLEMQAALYDAQAAELLSLEAEQVAAQTMVEVNPPTPQPAAPSTYRLLSPTRNPKVQQDWFAKPNQVNPNKYKLLR